MQPGDDTRHRLLEAAGQIFAEKGFQAATVREICSRAGANLAAVNYHFGDKERLYVETVRMVHRDVSDQPPPDWPPETPPAVKLREFIYGMLSHMLEVKRPAWHAELMMREMIHPTAACAELVEADIRPRVEMLQRILDELVPADTPEVDRHLIAFSIVGQCLFYNVHNRVAVLIVGEAEYRTYGIGRLADHITRFTLAGLGQDVPVQATAPANGGRS